MPGSAATEIRAAIDAIEDLRIVVEKHDLLLTKLLDRIEKLEGEQEKLRSRRARSKP